jgi:hypothetical protein
MVCFPTLETATSGLPGLCMLPQPIRCVYYKAQVEQDLCSWPASFAKLQLHDKSTALSSLSGMQVLVV